MLMRPDSELQIFLLFDQKKGLVLLCSTMLPKSDRIQSYLRIRWAKSSDVELGLNSDDLAHRILKSKNGIGL